MPVSLHLNAPMIADYVGRYVQVRAYVCASDAPHMVFTMRPRAARQLARVIARALERAEYMPRVAIANIMGRRVFFGSTGCVCVPVYGVDVYASVAQWSDSLSAIRAALGE